MGKKRKYELDLDMERSMHSTFVAAANQVSLLYTQAVQQHKQAHSSGARQALDRAVNWALKEHGSAQSIPTHELLAYLQHELNNVDYLDAQEPAPVFALPTLPVRLSTECEADRSGDEMMRDSHPKNQRQGGVFGHSGITSPRRNLDGFQVLDPSKPPPGSFQAQQPFMGFKPPGSGFGGSGFGAC